MWTVIYTMTGVTAVGGMATAAIPVVTDADDFNVIDNILRDLPLEYAFKAGKTDLLSGIKAAAETAAMWRQGEYQAGLEPIAQALARQPENAQFQLMAGLLLEGTGNLRDAYDHLELARGLAPEGSDSITRAWVQVALGRVCKQLGLVDDARGHWFQVMNTEETRTAFAEAQAALRQLDREQQSN